MRARTILLAGLSAALCAAGPASAAPDEQAYGRDAGYPVGNMTNWAQQRHLVGSQAAMERIFSTRVVKAAAEPRVLEPVLPTADPAPAWPEIATYLDTHPVTGLLVLRDGRIVAEHYQYGRSATDRFTSWSMAKTVVAMAVGVAVAEGRIASIDDPVDRYEPVLAGTGWKGVSIRHVLNMASGVAFDETYDSPQADIAYLSRAWSWQDGSLLTRLRLFGATEAAPGSRFKYISADTQVLTQVLARATGQRLSDYVGEKIWAPMGAEDEGRWILDRVGMEAGYCCLSARLRDWGRLGQMLLDEGRVGQRQVVPADWVRQATTVREADAHLAPRRATPYFGYGFQTWVFPDGLGFALMGVRGQAVFVHPPTRLVMVQTAVWPRSTADPVLGRQRDQFWRALVRRAGG